MENELNLKSCPFCNSAEAGIEIDTMPDQPVYFIICYDCLCKGGEGLTQKQAALL
jgi:hypothetical protein